MNAHLGCVNRYGVFFQCDDCMHVDNADGCALYRKNLSAKIGFEIRG